MVPGLVFNIQRFCTHDGPGIRSLLFIKGCPLRCKWCSNPESQNFSPELMYNSITCIKCGTCIKKCPLAAITAGTDNKLVINRSRCNLCGICVENCSTKSLEISGQQMSIQEIISKLTKDRSFYEMSNGGVTLSGGEPLANVNFARNILSELKNEGIHTAVETSGYVNTTDFVSIIKLVDLFLFDIKHMDEQQHIQGTDRSNNLIINNLTIVALSGAKVIIRYPLIPGYNSDEETLSKVSSLMKEIGLQEIDILPYHRLGSAKYLNLGRDYELNHIDPPEKNEILRVRNFFKLKEIKKVTVY